MAHYCHVLKHLLYTPVSTKKCGLPPENTLKYKSVTNRANYPGSCTFRAIDRGEHWSTPSDGLVETTSNQAPSRPAHIKSFFSFCESQKCFFFLYENMHEKIPFLSVPPTHHPGYTSNDILPFCFRIERPFV